ncbi:DNA excision repair protein ERCC-8 [Irineochytrium annulatum]|nr:DNA excision repair protein ERCC-8 [Irineochytrium annulatum]
MRLYGGKNIGGGAALINEALGQCVEALEVISRGLGYVKNGLIEQLNSSQSSKPKVGGERHPCRKILLQADGYEAEDSRFSFGVRICGYLRVRVDPESRRITLEAMNAIRAREYGLSVTRGRFCPQLALSDIIKARFYSVSLSENKEVARVTAGPVNDLAIDGTGERYMVAGFANSSIRIYDLADTAKPSAMSRSLVKSIAVIKSKRGHKFSVTGVGWYPFDTGIFTSSSMDGTVCVWDTASVTGQCALKFELAGKVYAHGMSLASTQRFLVAAATEHQAVAVCDMGSGAIVARLQGFKAITCHVNADSTIRIWDIRKANASLRTIDVRQAPKSMVKAATNRKDLLRTSPVNGLSFTSDGRAIVSLAYDDHVQLWDPATGQAINTTQPMIASNRHNSSIRFYVTPTSHCRPPLAFVPSDSRIVCFNLQSGEVVSRLGCHWGRVTCVGGRASVQELYSGGVDNEILCWDPEVAGRDEF